MTVHKRGRRSGSSGPSTRGVRTGPSGAGGEHGAQDGGSSARSGTRAERTQQTRQALLDAALARIDAGASFDALSLRSVARDAGIVPTAFYRHFASMDELGLALVDETFRTLRTMLRQARDAGVPPHRIVRSSVEILVDRVASHRLHFAFIVRARAGGNGVLRHAIRSEIRLMTSELATDLARFMALRGWSTEDLTMLAGSLVNTVIVAVEAMIDLAGGARGVSITGPDATSEITRTAEKQMLLTLLGTVGWHPERDV